MLDEQKKLIQEQHRLEQAQMRNRSKEQKARTRRLIQEGAILEKVFPWVKSIADLEELENRLCAISKKAELRRKRLGRPGRLRLFKAFFPEGRTYSPPTALQSNACRLVYCLRQTCALRGYASARHANIFTIVTQERK